MLTRRNAIVRDRRDRLANPDPYDDQLELARDVLNADLAARQYRANNRAAHAEHLASVAAVRQQANVYTRGTFWTCWNCISDRTQYVSPDGLVTSAAPNAEPVRTTGTS